MNLVGKIFVVVLFVQSLAFMAFAVCVYGTHKNWKDEIYREAKDTKVDQQVGYAAQLQAEQAKNRTLTNDWEKSQLKLEEVQASFSQVVAKLESERRLLAKSYIDITIEKDAAVAAKMEHAGIVATAQQELSKIAVELIAMRKRIADTQGERNEQFEKVVVLTDAIHGLLAQQDILAETNKTLVAEVTRYKTAMTQLGTSVTAVLASNVAPPVDGVVLAVGRQDMLEISIGSDDGLKTGHLLHVFRKGKYLGEIEILRITPDKSVAKVDPTKKQGPIQKGDIVATKI